MLVADLSDEQCSSSSRYVILTGVLAILFIVAFATAGVWPDCIEPFSFLWFSFHDYIAQHSAAILVIAGAATSIYPATTTSFNSIGSLKQTWQAEFTQPIVRGESYGH
jgi:hypothetical protein